ncbi:SDR family NAD(P)-dependent oxidoreductase [Mesorhizobium sp. KR9-304]|uniref:SDR family NAD(P)-dependent oxidoreductase n=1 Tax=Mesorhizobium sp. KR9-304 TaxID=3156614 RepID=UPI0032B576B2
MTISFDGQVAIVTGSGRGLGRSYARELAARGARVAVVDLGPDAASVAGEIVQGGGIARGYEVDVTDFEAVTSMAGEIMSDWGRVDVLINNAGILRDKSFAKMDLTDFRTVVDVHLMGSVNCAKAVWQTMIDRKYGRILFTSSSSGMYGNFGQSNYGAAKAAMLGLMNVLHLEGEKHGIRVNCVTPSAATHMTEGLLKPAHEKLLTPESVAPGVAFLVSRDAPSRVIIAAGAGSFARIYVTETQGVSFPPDRLTAEAVRDSFHAISDTNGAVPLQTAFQQTDKLAALALHASASGE